MCVLARRTPGLPQPLWQAPEQHCCVLLSCNLCSSPTTLHLLRTTTSSSHPWPHDSNMSTATSCWSARNNLTARLIKIPCPSKAPSAVGPSSPCFAVVPADLSAADPFADLRHADLERVVAYPWRRPQPLWPVCFPGLVGWKLTARPLVGRHGVTGSGSALAEPASPTLKKQDVGTSTPISIKRCRAKK